jgi:lysophospholipase L1-like esterase
MGTKGRLKIKNTFTLLITSRSRDVRQKIRICAALLICLLPLNTRADDLRVDQLRVGKVLFLGNSITLHGPAENIGWKGNWGMAASSAEKDYVHLLLARIADAAHGKPTAMVRNIADFERQHPTYDIPARLKPELDFEADLIIVAIGENVPALKTPEAQAQYRTAFANLLAELRKHGHPTLIVRSCFWADGTKDDIMRQESATAAATWVDISALGKVEQNHGRAEHEWKHAGIGAHPGDRGMEAIAEALWTAIKQRAAMKAE